MRKSIQEIKIGKRKIGERQPAFIVAEMSGNHNHNIGNAKKIIEAAAEAGVDAIKLQTYTADTLTINSNKKWFRISKGHWKDYTLHDLYKTAYTPWEWFEELKQLAEEKGLIFFSSVFDETAVDFMESLEAPLYKVASFELTDLELLKQIGKTRKPVIISRGMATKNELQLALKTLRKAGSHQIAVLHCISAYPAEPEDMNLKMIPDIASKFKVIAGLSDHTLGIITALISIGLGAKIIEKHFTLSRADGGVDAGFSLEPQEMRELVKSVRDAEKALGFVSYGVQRSEKESVIFRRSLFIIRNMKKGEKFTPLNIRSIRPGYGLAPKFFRKIVGRQALKNIEAGTPLSWDLIH